MSIDRLTLDDAINIQHKYSVAGCSLVLYKYDLVRSDLLACWKNMPHAWYHDEAKRRTEIYFKESTVKNLED